MTVKEFYTMETIYDTIPKDLSQIKTAQLLQEGVLYNCSARVEIDEGKFVPKGNCTEVGMIKFLQDVQVSAYDVLKTKEGNILTVVPFNSMRKRASTVVRHPTVSDTVRVFLKGAPEIVLDFCTKTFDKNGQVVDLSEKNKDKLVTDIITNTFAKKAYRTLLIAYKDMSVSEYETVKKANNNFATEADRQILE
jgi:magnesium-transporting ATPase (P-type)